MSQEKNPVYNTRKATREKRAREAAVQPQVAAPVIVAAQLPASPLPAAFTPDREAVVAVYPLSPAAALTPVFHTPRVPHAQRGLIFNAATPREADQTPTPTPNNSPAKMARVLRESPAVTPVRGNNNAEASPWTPGKFAGSPWTAGSPGNLDDYLGYGALHQRSPGLPSLPNSPGFRFDSPVRAQVQTDAYDTANETLLNYIQTVLGNENIDAAEMLRIVTDAKTSVSNALKALPQSSAQLAAMYQEFVEKLNPFIGLINERQRQAQPLTSHDLTSFLMTLSTPRQAAKAGL